MSFELPDLPYSRDALEPHYSSQTIDFHYGKHHKTYVDKLNQLIEGSPLAGQSLEDIIIHTSGQADKVGVFNNAAQIWNHTFFWQSMTPKGGGQPTGELYEKLCSDFGSFENFKKEFIDAAATQFGSGWTWLVWDQGKLKIVKTANADNPMSNNKGIALLTCDVWEHAYYLDYQNRRPDFVATFLDHLVNWTFVAQNLEKAKS